MTTPSSVHSIHIERLTGSSNYQQWAFSIKMLLRLEGLWGHVTDSPFPASVQISTATEDVTKSKPSGSSASDSELQLRLRDDRALAKICLHIHSDLYPHVSNCETAKEAWDKLATMFASKSLTTQLTVLREIVRTKLADFDSMQNYIAKVLSLSAQLAAMEKSLDDPFVAVLLLNGLDESYDPLIMALENSSTEITSDLVKNKLLAEDSRRQGNAEASVSAYHTKYSRRPKCDKCNKDNHTTSEHRNRRPKSSQSKTTKPAPPAGQKPQHKKTPTNSAASNVVLFTALHTKASPGQFIIDSGCNVHVVVTEPVNLDSLTARLTLANNKTAPVHGHGNYKIPHTDLILGDAYYAPSLHTNLISVSKMVNNGHSVTFNAKGCIIRSAEGKLLATATQRDGLYSLDIPAPSSASKVTPTRNASPPAVVPTSRTHAVQPQPRVNAVASSTEEVWHNRLAHLNHRSMKRLKDGLATGIAYSDEKFAPCVICVEGKIRRVPISTAPGTRALKILDLVHTDISVVNIPSLGGARFALILVDDFSRKTWIYLMKHKSDTYEKFLLFQNLVENQTGRKIKVLRSDNGTEYFSQKISAAH